MAMIMLENKDRQEAVETDRKIMEALKDAPPNYTGLAKPGRFFDGACGEIAFRKWLLMKGLRFEETSRTDGRPDKQDFILYTRKAGRSCTVNVKCSLHPRALYLMQPADQHAKHHQDLYVGSTGEDDGDRVVVILAGAIPRKQFDLEAERKTVSIPSLIYPLGDLPYSMERIANSFEKERKSE